MRQVDYKNGKIFGNVMQSVLPMLVAQVLSLLYSIVDRIYIGRILGEGMSGRRCSFRASSTSDPTVCLWRIPSPMSLAALPVWSQCF